jgi:hypothetical protein
MTSKCPNCGLPLASEPVTAYLSDIGRRGGAKSSHAKTAAAKRNIQKRWRKAKETAKKDARP